MKVTRGQYDRGEKKKMKKEEKGKSEERNGNRKIEEVGSEIVE